MNRECILEQAKQHDSFYLYEEAIIRKNTLKTDFPGVTFLYSVKCNPYPEVLRCVLNQGFGVDAASLAECVMGQKAGLGKDMVIFSAPGKTMADIRGGLGISTLVADSAAEVERIQEAAAEQGIVAEIGLRVNPIPPIPVLLPSSALTSSSSMILWRLGRSCRTSASLASMPT